MRINLKTALLATISCACFTTLLFFTRCGDQTFQRHVVLPYNQKRLHDIQFQPVVDQDDTYLAEVDHSLARQRHGHGNQEYEEIECHINGEYTINCRRDGAEIYVPFSFIHKYFEVYGKLTTLEGNDHFEWSHSYSKVYYPKGKYNPRGVFMYFENYNVEVRDRVKCITGQEGVPVSTQWETRGYFYPTQIAQFGLAHYSKNISEPEPRRTSFEDGDVERANWVESDGWSAVVPILDSESNQWVVEFRASDAELGHRSGITTRIDRAGDFVLSLDIKPRGNCSFTVQLENKEKKETFYMHYLFGDILIYAEGHHIYHGLGHSDSWKHVTRDLAVDMQKGLLLLQGTRKKFSRSKLRIGNFTLHGLGFLDNLTISTSEHMDQFFAAADWFVGNQDKATGGWPIPVKRRFAAGMIELNAGWYSAMGQGHALSVLSRAYHLSGKQKYLNAAVRGLKPFHVPSDKNGVRANFSDKYVWYEEYPTTPSSFVLNGFIYSLLGLYDLMLIAETQSASAKELFELGMVSLKKLLLLFDTGSGSTYDLRHFSLGVAPNIARWDYHTTHINQLLLLSTIDNDPILAATAERWIGYMSGKRAPHN